MKTPRIVAALAAAALLLVPAAAHAATPGLNLDGAPTSSSIQEAIATGAKTVRIFALWRDFEPNHRGEFPSSDTNLGNTVKALAAAAIGLTSAEAAWLEHGGTP